jgi:hypothetical protein
MAVTFLFSPYAWQFPLEYWECDTLLSPVRSCHSIQREE